MIIIILLLLSSLLLLLLFLLLLIPLCCLLLLLLLSILLFICGAHTVVGYSLGGGIADTLANNTKHIRHARLCNSPTITYTVSHNKDVFYNNNNYYHYYHYHY